MGRQIGRYPGRYWLVLSTVGHLYPQHLEDGEQILICDMGNGAQNKLTNNSMSVFSFFFVVYPVSTLSHTFTTYSHSILIFFRDATHINKAKYWSKKTMYRQNKNIPYSKGPICSRFSIHSINTYLFVFFNSIWWLLNIFFFSQNFTTLIKNKYACNELLFSLSINLI